jgi:hypothetical protein
MQTSLKLVVVVVVVPNLKLARFGAHVFLWERGVVDVQKSIDHYVHVHNCEVVMSVSDCLNGVVAVADE